MKLTLLESALFVLYILIVHSIFILNTLATVLITKFLVCLFMYTYILSYAWYLLWAKVFHFHIESPPEWDSCPRPLPNWPLSYLAERLLVLNGLQDRETTKLKSSLADCSDRIQVTLAANFLYFLFLQLHSE